MLPERILILSDPFSAGGEEGSEIADGECVRLSLVFKVTTPVTPAETTRLVTGEKILNFANLGK